VPKTAFNGNVLPRLCRTLSKHVQLMTQNQNFSFKPPSRLEAVAQRADEKEGNCDHQPQTCSDSVTAATPADGVFGSDRYTG
jgi:hypothetical protein